MATDETGSGYPGERCYQLDCDEWITGWSDYCERHTKCDRCRNWLIVCGHHLPLKDRLKSISIDRTSLR